MKKGMKRNPIGDHPPLMCMVLQRTTRERQELYIRKREAFCSKVQNHCCTLVEYLEVHLFDPFMPTAAKSSLIIFGEILKIKTKLGKNFNE